MRIPLTVSVVMGGEMCIGDRILCLRSRSLSTVLPPKCLFYKEVRGGGELI